MKNKLTKLVFIVMAVTVLCVLFSMNVFADTAYTCPDDGTMEEILEWAFYDAEDEDVRITLTDTTTAQFTLTTLRPTDPTWIP